MRSGQLRHRIIIESKVTVHDSTYGETTVTWSSNVGLWADIRPLRGRRYDEARQVHSAVTHSITTRYATLAASTAIRPGYCRVNFGGRIFTLEHVADLEERHYRLEMLASEDI
jgi:SPP1 family predicted phage head-tail adaptor